MTAYFSDLNYSLANEDTRIELDLLPEEASCVFVIPSSGAQALPLLSKNPSEMVVVDISLPQIFLTELRIESMRALRYDEWIYFMGYTEDFDTPTTTTESREELFRRLHLRPETKTYWKGRAKEWAAYGFIWLGRWERFFRTASKTLRTLFGYRFDRFFEATDLETQRAVYEKFWPKRRFRVALEILSSRKLLNELLYRGSYGQSGVHQSTPEQYELRYKHGFTNHLAAENFFLQMLFLGRVKSPLALPVEAQRDVFEKAQKSRTKISYFHGPYEDHLFSRPYDFIHLSDVLTYVPRQASEEILERLHPKTPDGAMFVARTVLKPVEISQPTGWTRLRENEDHAVQTDLTCVYDFLIYQRGNGPQSRVRPPDQEFRSQNEMR